MKNFIFLLALVGCSFKVSSQVNLVEYNFDNGFADPSNLNYSLIGASDVTSAGVSAFVTNGAGHSGLSGDYGMVSNGWPQDPTSWDSNRYLEFTITANPGKTIRVDKVGVWRRLSNSPNFPQDFHIYSSDNSFGWAFFYCTTNPGHSGPVVTPNWYYCSANTSYIINSGSSLTFRIYAGYAHNSLGGTLILDSITVDGTDLTTLPITLTSFNAFENNRDVDITWSTATEQNNEHFIVERSEDARNYQEIARVDGAGNSQHRIDYSIVDPSPSVGWHYYRLTQVDYNGQYEVFDGQVVPVYIRGAPEIVFPNPASVGEVVHVPAGCKVIDSLGRLVQSGNDTFTPTSSGVYLVGNQKLVVR